MTHGDAPNAYIKGILREIIYMKASRELDVEEVKVLKLFKPFTGLNIRIAAGMRR